MLRPLGNALSSSIGRKFIMGVTGLLLVGFAVNHLVGNLKLLPIPFVGDAAGEKFDEYVAFLKSFGGLLYVAEIGLVVLFGAHIWLALKLTMENREARRTGYHVRSDRGAKSVGSASMHVTGALLLAFLIKHMLDFRFDEAFHETPAAIVYAKLAQPANALSGRVVDWISGNYNYKMGVGQVRKMGESPYKTQFRSMSFARRDIA